MQLAAGREHVSVPSVPSMLGPPHPVAPTLVEILVAPWGPSATGSEVCLDRNGFYLFINLARGN